MIIDGYSPNSDESLVRRHTIYRIKCLHVNFNVDLDTLHGIDERVLSLVAEQEIGSSDEHHAK